MKRRTIYLTAPLISIVLSGCLGFGTNDSSNEAKAPTGYKWYETNDIRMLVLQEWEQVSELKYKFNQHAIAAFRSNVRNNQFTPNIVIMKNALRETTTSQDYARALYKKVTDELVSTRDKEVKVRKIRIGGSEQETLFTDLEGRESADADKKRFMHTSGVKGKEAFVVVAAARVEENLGVIEKLRMSVESFEVK